jgi:hypothetical protein
VNKLQIAVSTPDSLGRRLRLEQSELLMRAEWVEAAWLAGERFVEIEANFCTFSLDFMTSSLCLESGLRTLEIPF